MRGTRMAVFVILAGLFGCAGQFGPRFPAPVGIEKSVYPIYVLSEKTTTIDGLKRRQTLAEHHGCSAFYAAPHLLVTSATVFFTNKNNNELATVNTSKIMVKDGSRWLNAQDVVYADAETGLAVIRTAEAGVPLVFQPENVLLPDQLDFVGFMFERVNSFQTMALPHWKSGQIYPINTERAFIEGLGYFMAKAEIFSGMCGAVVFDSDQRVVGIVHRRHGDRVSVISVATIRRALKEAGNE